MFHKVTPNLITLHSSSDKLSWHKQVLKADAAGWVKPKRHQWQKKAVSIQGHTLGTSEMALQWWARPQSSLGW